MKVPHNFMCCLCHDCPKAADCLRYLAGTSQESEKESFSCYNPKYPTAATADCMAFLTNQKQTYAIGMKGLLDNVPYRAAAAIKERLIYHFTRKRFYKMVRGTIRISPQDREYIARVFREEGAGIEPVYNSFIEEYIWY